jgi:hypothetical protein
MINPDVRARVAQGVAAQISTPSSRTFAPEGSVVMKSVAGALGAADTDEVGALEASRATSVRAAPRRSRTRPARACRSTPLRDRSR